jgi:hypothetical protein
VARHTRPSCPRRRFTTLRLCIVDCE